MKSSRSHISVLMLILLVLCGLSFAQTTPNSVPKYINDTGDMASTPLYIDDNGNVGVGTDSPSQRLHVKGGHVFVARPDYYGDPATYWGLVVATAGNTNLSVFAQSGPSYTTSGPLQWLGNSMAFIYYPTELRIGTGLGPLPAIELTNVGNVGIGTTTPSQKLEVAGDIKVTGSVRFQDGSAQQTAWTGVLCGGDYAESVDVSGDRNRYSPGDVMVIDPAQPGRFLKSAEAYSTLVAGIYSTKPGAIGRRSRDAAKQKDEVPMAMVGIVPTRVSAENGPIHVGDLLVTSATLGHAMKGTDRTRMTGAVVGKALDSLESGTGVIEVLVSLQ